MTTENVSPESLDAPKPTPAAPPAHYVDASLLSDRAMQEIDHLLTLADRDKIESARIAARQLKREEEAKLQAERDASTKRAKAVTDEVVKRGELDENGNPIQTEERGTPGEPVKLELPPLLAPDQVEIAQAYTEDMGVIAEQLGLPAEQAQTMLNFVIGAAQDTMPDLNTANPDEVKTHLRTVYGEVDSTDIINKAQAAYKLLPQDIQRWIDSPNEAGEQLGNHPAVLSMLALYGEGFFRLTQKEATEKLTVLRSSKAYFGGDKRTIDKVRLLGMIVTRGHENDEMAFEAPAAKPVPTAVQARINAIRSDPGFTSLDSKVRKPLVAELGRLMAQLHQG